MRNIINSRLSNDVTHTLQKISQSSFFSWFSNNFILRPSFSKFKFSMKSHKSETILTQIYKLKITSKC